MENAASVGGRWLQNFDWHKNFKGIEYQGMNQILLSWFAPKYGVNQWITFKQAKDLGGNIKKGAKGSLVVFASQIEVKDETAEDGKKKIWYQKPHWVFNIEQTEGLPAHYYEYQNAKFADFAAIEAIVENIGLDLRFGGNTAGFAPHQDYIIMPHKSAFVDQSAYYSTLAHELVHWTGHASRLNRGEDTSGTSAAYAFEELVAELGAAFLCAKLGFAAEPRADHAAYLNHYLKLLKNDKRAIFRAAKAAQNAVDYLINAQPALLLMAAE